MKFPKIAAIAKLTGAVCMAALGGALMLNADLPIFQATASQVRNWILAAALFGIALRLIGPRKEGVLVLLAWYAGSLASLPFIWSGFFGNAWGWFAYAGLAATLSLPAFLAPRRWPVVGVLVAIALATVPPLGFFGLGNPLLLAGALFPGAGWAGIALFFVALSLSAVRDGRAGKLAVLGQGAVLAWAMIHVAVPAPQPPQTAWAATTYFGENPESNLTATFDAQDKAKAMTTDALNAGAKLVLLPEGTDKLWDDGQAFYWNDVAALAREKHAQVLIGAYSTPLGGSERADGLVDLTADTLHPARIAVPFGMWVPWRKHGNFELRLGATRPITSEYGQAAYLVCYEELLPWPLMLQMAGERPALLLSVANQWFGEGWLLRPQARSLTLQARLWGLPVIRAVNYAPVDFGVSSLHATRLVPDFGVRVMRGGAAR